MQLSQTTGPAAYTKQKLLQALKDAGFAPNSTPSSDSTAARIGPGAGPRSNVDLMGPLKAAGIVSTTGPQTGSVNLMGPLRSAGMVTPTQPDSPRGQAAALAAGLTAWNQQQAELQREQEEAARQAAEERQEQEQERARIDAELAEDDQSESDSGDSRGALIDPATADLQQLSVWAALQDDDSTNDSDTGTPDCVPAARSGLLCTLPSHDAKRANPPP